MHPQVQQTKKPCGPCEKTRAAIARLFGLRCPNCGRLGVAIFADVKLRRMVCNECHDKSSN